MDSTGVISECWAASQNSVFAKIIGIIWNKILNNGFVTHKYKHTIVFSTCMLRNVFRPHLFTYLTACKNFSFYGGENIPFVCYCIFKKKIVGVEKCICVCVCVQNNLLFIFNMEIISTWDQIITVNKNKLHLCHLQGSILEQTNLPNANVLGTIAYSEHGLCK